MWYFRKHCSACTAECLRDDCVDVEVGQNLFKVPQKRKKKDKYHEIKSPLRNDSQLEDHEKESE